MFRLHDKHIAKIVDIFGINLRETLKTLAGLPVPVLEWKQCRRDAKGEL